MKPFLDVRRDGAIVTACMDRPESRNALSDSAQFQEFIDLCESIASDRSVRVLILTGTGPAFCAGGNIKDMSERGGIFAGSPYDIRNNYRSGIQRIPRAVYELEVPVIAAINGAAVGAGLDLACMCDIRIAADSARFAESFVKLGIVAGDGGAWLLPRIIGMPKASIMALTGDTIDAETALAWDLVTTVVPAEELQSTAQELARRIVANPSHALRLTKRLLREGQHMRLDSLLEMSAAFQALAHHADDHAEAVAAFLEKRRAQYSDQ